MAQTHIKVAHIVASSTDEAWSQTYHAGGVTAVVSVQHKKNAPNAQSLSLVGKDLLNTFESEYFTLETKNLSSIKTAVETTYNKSKQTHDIALIVSAVIQNAVYVVLAGKGKILLIRSNTLATLLEQDGTEVLSASGFLEPEDVMILETLPFAEKIPSSTLLETLTSNTVEDAAEILSPTIHKDQMGAEAALLLSYHDSLQPSVVKTPEQKMSPEITQEETTQPEETQLMQEDTSFKPTHDRLQAGVMEHALPKKHTSLELSHRQKIFLTIAIIVAVVFVGTIFLSLQHKQANQTTQLFATLYPPAEKKYEEGLGLKDLNATLAHDDFEQAQSMLQSAKSKFPASSSQATQIQSLLDKVNAQLATPVAPSLPQTDAVKVANSEDSFMAFMLTNASKKYFAQDDTNYYYADSSGVTRVNKSSSKSTQVITNSGDWQLLGGFETYLGNMYVVDTTDGIDKYAGASSGFGNKAAYFSGTTPDLSKVVSMAIDGSVWLVTSDGKISQYTKGKAVIFTLSGLTLALSSPTQIITTVDDDNLYILDTGNGRIVVIKKDTGSFVAQYANTLLKSATQLDVNEKTKTAYFLSGGTIYKMSMK